MCRRLASSKVNNAENSQAEHAPNVYEMSSNENSQPIYSTVDDQSEASTPAISKSATKPTVTNAAKNGRIQPSAPPPRSSVDDFTLVDNDLYG